MSDETREVRMEADCDLRAVGDKGKAPTRLEGYAALFNKRTELWDGYHEQIAPGAFARTLREGADVRALFNHDPNAVLGRNKAGTLTLRETKKGLKVNIWPPDTQVGRDVLTSVARGDISQMSFAFRAMKTSDEDLGTEGWLRTLEDVELFDVSPVTYPAYADTTVAARQHEQRTGETVPVAEHTSMSDVAADRDAEVVIGEPETATEADAETLLIDARLFEKMVRWVPDK